jgi:MFS superfamily sulfate permease-like transporter
MSEKNGVLTAPAGPRATWPRDLLASVVVFLVALPLCMGVAIASGAPPAQGLLTGIIGGIVVGLLGGSPLQVSGPAAGLTVLVWEFLRPYQGASEGDRGLAQLGLAVLLAGALQLALGLLKMGQWFRAVSPAVVHGMLAGIGLLIFASQFHVMVDDDPKGSGLQNLIAIPEAVVKGLTPSDSTTHHLAAFVGVVTLLVLAGWKALAPGRLQLVPAPLLAVTCGTAIAVGLGLPVERVELPPLASMLHLPAFAELAHGVDWGVVKTGVAIAFIASAETLLCATAVDQLHRGPRTKYDKELAAQGVGNMLCGLLGGLPMTGVIVRSAANVEAGAKTRLSAVLHGVWLLLAVLLLGPLLARIPTAALAAVLVYTGYKLMDPKHVRQLLRTSKGEVAICVATFLTIVATDLLTGVVVGVGLSLARLVYAFSRLSVRLEADPLAGRTVMYLRGAATFIRLPKLAATLEQVPPSTELHVHFEGLSHIDHACLDLLLNWEKQHEATGGSLVIDWEDLGARFRHFGNYDGGRAVKVGRGSGANTAPVP